jgi:hypothetical protein
LFKAAYGVDIIHVPFTGGGPAMNSTIGGHTPISFPALSTAAPSIVGGKVRGLAVMSPKRSPHCRRADDGGIGPGRSAGRRLCRILLPAGAWPVVDLPIAKSSKRWRCRTSKNGWRSWASIRWHDPAAFVPGSRIVAKEGHRTAKISLP